MSQSDIQKRFDYCEKVDLHALATKEPLETITAIASEHGFRGIVVSLSKIDQLVKLLNRPLLGDKNVVPACIIDYPFGDSSKDVRAYSIQSAKERGAREIEIVAPYHLIAVKDFKKIYEDAQNIVNVAERANVAVKYVLDYSNPYVDDTVRTKLCRILSSTKIPTISTSLGFFDKKIDHADSILQMRGLKSKTGCKIKAYLKSLDPSDLMSYAKAGADIIGLDWRKAVFLVHAYEDIVEKKE
jgi:deoxyribose-phosphate aldolase